MSTHDSHPRSGRSALFAAGTLALLWLSAPTAAASDWAAHSDSGMSNTVSIDFTTFPDGTPIPQNLNGEYGPPGTTSTTPVSNQFESLGVVFESPPALPGIIVGPPSCEFCSHPPVGGLLVSSSPAFFGDIRMRFLVRVTAVTIDIIGSGLNIGASLKAYDGSGVLLGAITHTYSGNTGVLSPFTFTAPHGKAIASVVYNGGLNHAAAASIGRLSFVTASCAGSDRRVYDARADFAGGWRAGTNPNGCWSYGWTKGLQGTLKRFPKASLYPINNGLEQMWYDPANDAGATPSIARNSGGDYDDNNVAFTAGALILHPCGKDGHAYAHAVWAAPRHGTYLVRSLFYAQQYRVNADVHVLVNGKRVFSDTLTQDQSQREFMTTVRLAMGDTVDFAVGPNGEYVLHPANTGLEAQIIRLAPKPDAKFGGNGHDPDADDDSGPN